LRFSRVLLKLSGEALMEGGEQFGHGRLEALAGALAEAARAGVRIGVVVGAGNIFRARSANLQVLGRVTADHIGMLGTVMNGAVLAEYVTAAGVPAVCYAPRDQHPLARAFRREAVLADLAAGRVVVLAGGTGNPFFTTDSAAALRALEIDAEVLLKGTQVDGVYDRDPRAHPEARRFASLSYREVLDRRLGVMDLTAVTLCAEQGLPLLVFDISQPRNLVKVLAGERLGTWIAKESQP
jgi:uridylate kinase